eukprot:scaffold206489_cov28-Tisochrysis_lutea.AAC.5
MSRGEKASPPHDRPPHAQLPRQATKFARERAQSRRHGKQNADGVHVRASAKAESQSPQRQLGAAVAATVRSIRRTTKAAEQAGVLEVQYQRERGGGGLILLAYDNQRLAAAVLLQTHR